MFEISIKEKDNKQWVLAKDLARELGVKTQVNRWMKRNITELRDIETGKSLFTSNLDFMTIRSKTKGRPRTDVYISIETAKEVAMLTKTITGKEIRNFFIDVQNAHSSGALIESSEEQYSLLTTQGETIKLLEKAVETRDKMICDIIDVAKKYNPKDSIGTISKKTGKPRTRLCRAYYVSTKKDDPNQLVLGLNFEV